MLPILHLSAKESKIDFTSGSNNNTITKVYDLSVNGFDATNTGNIYYEEYEGIKAFAFKSQGSTKLINTTLTASGTSSFTLACTAASLDLSPSANNTAFFGVGGANLTGRCIATIKTGTAYNPSHTSISDAATYNTNYDAEQKWNAYILTYDSISQNVIVYCNTMNNYISSVRALNIIAGYNMNALPATNSYGSSKGYISEAMVFNTCLTDSQINNLFQYFQKNLSASSVGGSKQNNRSPIFGRVGL